jgi:hypothetical protein
MKKIMTAMLGLSLVFGATAVCFGQSTTTSTKTTKTKKAKKSTTSTSKM